LLIEKHDAARPGGWRIDHIACQDNEVDSVLDGSIKHAFSCSICRIGKRPPQMFRDLCQAPRDFLKVQVARVQESKGRIHHSPSSARFGKVRVASSTWKFNQAGQNRLPDFT
jgi:hypothetical protein